MKNSYRNSNVVFPVPYSSTEKKLPKELTKEEDRYDIGTKELSMNNIKRNKKQLRYYVC